MWPVPGKQNAPILAIFHFHSSDEMRPTPDTRRKHVWIAGRQDISAAAIGHTSQIGMAPCAQSLSSHPRTHPLAIRTKKQRGRFLLRDLALSVPIFGDPVRLQITTLVIQNHPSPTSYARGFAFFHDHTHCKSFSLPSVSSCLDRVSLPILGDDRYSAISFWKITLPLKAILLFANENASGFCNLLLWK